MQAELRHRDFGFDRDRNLKQPYRCFVIGDSCITFGRSVVNKGWHGSCTLDIRLRKNYNVRIFAAICSQLLVMFQGCKCITGHIGMAAPTAKHFSLLSGGILGLMYRLKHVEEDTLPQGTNSSRVRKCLAGSSSLVEAGKSPFGVVDVTIERNRVCLV